MAEIFPSLVKSNGSQIGYAMRQGDTTPLEPISQEQFREVMARFVSGVAIISARDYGRSVGATVSSVISVSMEPRLLLVSLAKKLYTLNVIEREQTFGVNFLTCEQEDLARHFATPRHEKFLDVHHYHTERNTPLIAETLAWVECALWDLVECGDHVLIIGMPVSAGTGSGTALAYHDRSYIDLRTGLEEDQ